MKSQSATFVMAAPEFEIECHGCGHEYNRSELDNGKCPACHCDPDPYADAVCDCSFCNPAE